jgi:hypothetical protein
VAYTRAVSSTLLRLQLVVAFGFLAHAFASPPSVLAAGCYVRSAPLFAKAKNFAGNDIAVAETSATLKGAVGNGYSNGTRIWDLPAARVCAGDQVSIVMRAGGQLALLSRVWWTTGTWTSTSLQNGLSSGNPERSFLAASPGSDLSGTSGSRTYSLTVPDSLFAIGVWVRDSQGDTGAVVWDYVAENSTVVNPRPQPPTEPAAKTVSVASPISEPSADVSVASPEEDLRSALTGCPGAFDLYTTLRDAAAKGALVVDPAQSALQPMWPRRDVLVGMLEKVASMEDLALTSVATLIFGESPHDLAAGTGYVNYLGSLLTEQAPPRHTANAYVQLTRDRRPLVDGTQQASYESALADRIIQSSGGLLPADVMRMALNVTGGDYPLATLTAHNLLKELKYSSTAQGGTGTAIVGWFADSRGTDAEALAGGQRGYDLRPTAPLVAKLVNLRPADDALYAADPVGPWYHQFGVFFVGSVTSGDEASLAGWVENGTRWLGLGSNHDTFKEATNTCAGRLATAISSLNAMP